MPTTQQISCSCVCLKTWLPEDSPWANLGQEMCIPLRSLRMEKWWGSPLFTQTSIPGRCLHISLRVLDPLIRKQQTRKIGQFSHNTKQKVCLSFFLLIIVRLCKLHRLTHDLNHSAFSVLSGNIYTDTNKSYILLWDFPHSTTIASQKLRGIPNIYTHRFPEAHSKISDTKGICDYTLRRASFTTSYYIVTYQYSM